MGRALVAPETLSLGMKWTGSKKILPSLDGGRAFRKEKNMYKTVFVSCHFQVEA